jgi:hypothetical protein
MMNKEVLDMEGGLLVEMMKRHRRMIRIRC